MIQEKVKNSYKKILDRYPHNEEIEIVIKEHGEKLKSNDGVHYLESILLESEEYKKLIKGKLMWKSFRDRTEKTMYSLNIPLIPKSSENCVVIVEPRAHNDYKYIMRNIMHMCNGKWSLHIFHGMKNESFVKEIVKGWGDVHFHNLGVDNLLPLPIGNSLDDLYKSESFWNNMKSHKYALCIQTDTLMMDKNIDAFLKFDYDYIGAPWADKVIGCSNDIRVGCGGFSLRKVQSMIKVIQSNVYEQYTPEDVFFSKYCENVAPFEIAKYFCTEHILNDFSLGLHRPWMYEHNIKILHKLEEYLLNYNNERI